MIAFDWDTVPQYYNLHHYYGLSRLRSSSKWKQRKAVPEKEGQHKVSHADALSTLAMQLLQTRLLYD
jgi:hypothetical protein